MKRKPCIVILCILLCAYARSQNNISIARTGKDKIAVYNRNNHSVAVALGGGTPTILPAYQGIQMNFSLGNHHNVERTPFTSYYNLECYHLDSSYCEWWAVSAEAEARARVWRASLVVAILQGTSLGWLKDFIDGIFGNNPELKSEIVAAYQSDIPQEQKELRINKILENYYLKQARIEENKGKCLERAFQQLRTNTSVQKVYASQFIRKQENFRFEISPYYVAGFNPLQYKGVNYKRPSFKTITGGKQLPVGVRTSFNFNAYDRYRQRKVDQKLYFTLDYSQSPAIYKKEPDSRFKEDSAYSWNFYAAGVGWETLYRNAKGRYNSSFSFDVGLITSSHSGYTINSLGNIGEKFKGKSFKELNAYGCITFRQKVFSWLDLSAGYKLSLSLFNKAAQNVDRSIPSFRQFQLGLNLVLKRVVSYQY